MKLMIYGMAPLELFMASITILMAILHMEIFQNTVGSLIVAFVFHTTVQLLLLISASVLLVMYEPFFIFFILLRSTHAVMVTGRSAASSVTRTTTSRAHLARRAASQSQATAGARRQPRTDQTTRAPSFKKPSPRLSSWRSIKSHCPWACSFYNRIYVCQVRHVFIMADVRRRQVVQGVTAAAAAPEVGSPCPVPPLADAV